MFHFNACSRYVSVIFKIYACTSYNNLINFIIKNTYKITLKNKQCYKVGKITFESPENPFYHSTWKNKGGTNNNKPILAVLKSHEIPRRLAINDPTLESDMYCYCRSITAKNDCKIDWVENMFASRLDDEHKPTFNDIIGDGDVKIDVIIDEHDHEEIENRRDNQLQLQRGNGRDRNDVDDHDDRYRLIFESILAGGCEYYIMDELVYWKYNDGSQVEIYKNLWRYYGLKYKKTLELFILLKQLYRQYLIESNFSEKEIIEKIKEMDKKVFDKYNDEIHKKMGQPLNYAELYGLILYTTTNIYLSVTEAQKQGNLSKYIVLDWIMYWSITKLHEFNVVKTRSRLHGGKNKNKNNCKTKDKIYRQIYSGAAGVKLDWDELNQRFGDEAKLKRKKDNTKLKIYFEFAKHTSFSCKLSVAKNFARGGDSSVYIVLNDWEGIVACDVSWISGFKNEQEVCVILLLIFCFASFLFLLALLLCV